MKLRHFTKGVASALFLAADLGLHGVGVITGGGLVVPEAFGSLAIGTELDATSVTFSDVTSSEWQATLSSKVYSGYAGNPYGGLTFEYRLSNDAAHNFTDPKLGALELAFGSLPGLDVGFLSPGGELPDAVSMPSSLLLRWGWAPGIGAGGFTATLIVHSQFSSYDLGAARVTGGGSYQEGIQVLVPVPEPSTYAALFALGLAGFAAYRRRGA